MIINQVATSYAHLNSFVNNNKATVGRYLVKNDETNLGNPTEYYYDGTKLLVISGGGNGDGGGLPTILGEVANETLIATTYPEPEINDGVIVKADTSQSDRRTWYVWDGEAWIYKGYYKGDTTQEEQSLTGTRIEVILANTEYSLPNDMNYMVGSDQLSVFMNNAVGIKGVDWVEFGSEGTQSKKIKFLSDIDMNMNLVFRKDVASTDLMYMQRNIDMDLVRKQTCNLMGVVYGGEVQYTTLREANKVYWCNINEKWYSPIFNDIVPALTANTDQGWTVSASSAFSGKEAFRAFDKISSSNWLNDYVARGTTAISDTSPEWIQIEKASPFHCNGLTLTSLKNGVNNGSQNYSPKKIKVEGWTGTAWVTLAHIADVKYNAGLVDGNLITFNNTNSYYKYKITFQEHMFPTSYSLAFSEVKVHSGKGSWLLADSDWEVFDKSKPRKILIDEASYPMVISGSMTDTHVSLELDIIRLLNTDTTTLANTIPKPTSNYGLCGSNGGYIFMETDGSLNYRYTVDAATKRGWVHVTYPYVKEERTYV